MTSIDDHFSPPSVLHAYNTLAGDYGSGRHHFDNSTQLHRLGRLIPPNIDALDVACGAGIPVTKYFVDRGDRVIGVDLSDRMLALAQRNVPNATQFIQKDLRDLDFPPNSFDLVTAFYCIFHIDRRYHEAIFQNFHRMLKPNGYTYATLASEDYTGQPEFHGVIEFNGKSLPYSHFTAETYRNMVTGIGFELLSAENLSIGGETMLWVLAQKIT